MFFNTVGSFFLSFGIKGSRMVTCTSRGDTDVMVASANLNSPLEKSRLFSKFQLSFLEDSESLLVLYILYRYARVSCSGSGSVTSNTTWLSEAFASS
jgi:hypothetical protein